MAQRRKKPKLTAENLKQTLWETMIAVQKREIGPAEATAVSSQAREIMRIVNAEIKIAEITGSEVSGVALLGAKK